MRNLAMLSLAACLALAQANPAAATGMFSASGPVIAMLGDELFTGIGEGHLDGSGTLAIHSERNPEVSCRGQFISSAALGGAGQLQCTDGANATFTFQRLTYRTGYGAGSFVRGPISF